MNVLFVTWDGPQVSYLEGLFVPIFQALGKHGVRFHVLQFTWGDAATIEVRRKACTRAGLDYRVIPIWRTPRTAGSLLTVLKGAYDIRRAIKDFDIDLVMPRSTIPALATMRALRASSLPMVFDADGLPLDERVDFAGESPSSFVYRLLRDVEAQAIRRASKVLTRSETAVDVLLARAGAGTDRHKFHVVSNGRNATEFATKDDDFRRDMRHKLGIAEDAPLLVYAGSMGMQYCFDEMLFLFSHIHERQPNARLLVMTGSPEWVARQSRETYRGLAFATTIISVPAVVVSGYLACADLGLALRRPSFSMQGVAPIKLGEYLLCGLPVVATDGIGDTASIVTRDVGILIDKTISPAQLVEAANWFVDVVLPNRSDFRTRCRDAGVRYFSLEKTVGSYQKVFDSIAAL